jgi:hypothetical protein
VARNGAKRYEVRPFEEKPVPATAYVFDTVTGRLSFDHAKCPACKTKGCVPACGPKILKLEGEKPVLAVSVEDAKKGKCTECLACEIFCKFYEQDAIIAHLPIPGLREYRERIRAARPPDLTVFRDS